MTRFLRLFRRARPTLVRFEADAWAALRLATS
jgi:hypothetical protein